MSATSVANSENNTTGALQQRLASSYPRGTGAGASSWHPDFRALLALLLTVSRLGARLRRRSCLNVFPNWSHWAEQPHSQTWNSTSMYTTKSVRQQFSWQTSAPTRTGSRLFSTASLTCHGLIATAKFICVSSSAT